MLSSSSLWPQAIESSILPCYSRAPSAVTGEPTPNNYLESPQKTMGEDSSQHAIQVGTNPAKMIPRSYPPFRCRVRDIRRSIVA